MIYICQEVVYLKICSFCILLYSFYFLGLIFGLG
ncbi:hypothetical protein [Plasmodium yoelii yoelii]|uniref:Uncharacterized protein n=1 Tax=Plasmodium yoelii yoelii TaxID=73239 RepID=Q7RH35_PLAYO|nr:hypothetical protein [Plasmodium yoelii yoelii]